MTNNVVQEFARYLAGLDDSERARALATAKMLGMQQAPAEAFEAPITPLGEYLAREIEQPPILIHPTAVVRGGINVVIGRAGKGKTVMALNRSLRWAAGLPMFDDWKDAEGNSFMAPEQPLKILIVENEGSAGMFHHQIGLMRAQDAFLDADAKKLADENILIWGDGGYCGLKLDDENKLNGLRAGVEKWEPDIVYIEPFRSLWHGEENSSTEMNVVVDNLVGLATDFNCGVIFAHHESKAGTEREEKMSAARGSTVLEGVVTLMENFEAVKAGAFRELSWSKVRYQDPHRQFPSPVRMEWVPDAWWYKWVPMSEIEEAVLATLAGNQDEPMSVKELADETGERDAKLRPVLKRLAEEQRVVRMPSVSGIGGSTGARYRLPSSETGHSGLEL